MHESSTEQIITEPRTRCHIALSAPRPNELIEYRPLGYYERWRGVRYCWTLKYPKVSPFTHSDHSLTLCDNLRLLVHGGVGVDIDATVGPRCCLNLALVKAIVIGLCFRLTARKHH